MKTWFCLMIIFKCHRCFIFSSHYSCLHSEFLMIAEISAQFLLSKPKLKSLKNLRRIDALVFKIAYSFGQISVLSPFIHFQNEKASIQNCLRFEWSKCAKASKIKVGGRRGQNDWSLEVCEQDTCLQLTAQWNGKKANKMKEAGRYFCFPFLVHSLFERFL